MARFRTRQAPSPTGYLHIGTARTVLFTDLIARHQQGEWYLRLEDTDRTRLVSDAAVKIIESLSSIHLASSEGITLTPIGAKDLQYGVYQQGKYGPYIQSERLDIYHKHAQKMIDKKLAYWSAVTESEKQDMLAIKQATKTPINYFLHATNKSGGEFMYMTVEEGVSHIQKPSLRYALQRQNTVECNDILAGTTTFDLSLEEDFVILKNDGYPTYHFAHVIDDHLMETSLVIRTQEWYPSFPKHVTMFKDYWGEVPEYLHLPFILGETGNKKLSKRDTIVDLLHYKRLGIPSEAIINYLAFLGWNPGTEQEVFLSQTEMLDHTGEGRLELLQSNLSKQFSFDKLSKSPARFNLEKLLWMSREYIKMMPLREFITRSSEHMGDPVDYSNSEPWKISLYLLDQNRTQTLAGLGVESGSVLDYKIPPQAELTWKKLTFAESKLCLKEIWENILSPLYDSPDAASLLQDQQSIYDLSATNTNISTIQELFLNVSKTFELICKEWLTTYGKDTGSYLWPLRVALSGKSQSASPFELLALLPRDQVKSRIEAVLAL